MGTDRAIERTKGWVVSWLITKSSDAQKPAKQKTQGSSSITSTASDLRIRTGPGTSYQVIGTFPQGASAKSWTQAANGQKYRTNKRKAGSTLIIFLADKTLLHPVQLSPLVLNSPAQLAYQA